MAVSGVWGFSPSGWQGAPVGGKRGKNAGPGDGPGCFYRDQADIDESTSVIQREAYEYDRTPGCAYPTSVNKMLLTSNDRLAAFDAFAHLDTVAPRPVLLIVGSHADTIYFSEAAYAKANEPKERVKIAGASHVDLYDRPEYVSQVVAKLVDFFGRSL